MADVSRSPEPLEGSLGSVFWEIRVPPAAIPEMAGKLDWNLLGRRVIIDPLLGLICWMTPSMKHEGYADAADKVVDRAGRLTGLRIKALRGGRWKRHPEDPRNTGMEADACFYIGATAEDWAAARKRCTVAVREFEKQTPPDLVVEIEWTGHDQDKARRWAELGVRELWRAERKGESVAVQILDLQTYEEPVSAAESLFFAGLDSFGVERLMDLAERTDLDAMEALLAELLSLPEPERSSGLGL